MLTRKATGEEMLKLWGYQEENSASPTAKFFYQNISSGNAVFWTLDHDGELIGELYAFLDIEDKDFADLSTALDRCARLEKHLCKIPVIDPEWTPEESILNEFIS